LMARALAASRHRLMLRTSAPSRVAVVRRGAMRMRG
jgi:hypothetical protein